MFQSERLQPSRYAGLGDRRFFAEVSPSPVQAPRLLHFNASLGRSFGLSEGDFSDTAFLDFLAGQSLPSGVRPLACAYSGHQFGVFNPSLGDGRAMLLGECEDQQGQRWEFQLKGAGPTPYSRGFDGRAVLRSVVREYLASEAMAGLGIPTTRALCIIDSQTPVYREEVERAAMMLRLAPSHLRFGSFEHFYAQGDEAGLRQLVDFCLGEYFPQCLHAQDPVAAWFQEVVEDTALLMAQWHAVGFCHGVMNTDNLSVLGLTLDYGPFGFLETYDPGHICNHADDQGRYAFEMQPRMALWNLHCLAQALTPLVDVDTLRNALKTYDPRLQAEYLRLMRAKLGLEGAQDVDEALIGKLLKLLREQKLDYSRFFRGLCQFVEEDLEMTGSHHPWLVQKADTGVLDDWLGDYRLRLEAESASNSQRAQAMRTRNPKYILRNYLAQEAIEAAEGGDTEPLDQLLRVLQSPFAEHPGRERFSEPAPAWAANLEVSCSS